METGKKIDRAAFVKIMAYIAAGIQKPITDVGLEVYYDLLGDLSADVLNIAAKRAVLEHRYATFPPVAVLRDLAIDTRNGTVKEMTGAEAFGIARKVIARCDIDVPHTMENLWKGVPPIVVAAVDAFGFMALYNLPGDAIETARAQFTRVFDSIAEREKRTGILPASVAQKISEIGNAKPQAISQTIAAIGVEKHG